MNREEWLTKAAAVVVTELGLEVTDFDISVGWPSKMGLSKIRRRLGECWKGETSDGRAQIYISPVLDDPVPTVAHELLHVESPESKHGPAFAKRAKALGFEGKPTAAEPGKELEARLNKVIGDLKIGDYPHAAITPTERQPQGTRLLKAECMVHGYVVRVTKKWLVDMGAPLCPCGQEMTHDEIEEDE